jgi:serine/threonine protein kinase
VLCSGNRGSSRTPLDWVTRVRVALGAARGLTYLHTQGGPRFVHGNIKSSNILLTRDLEACISDFGLAQLLSSPAAASRIVGYRAPEITQSRKVLTQKSDVYSFGVVTPPVPQKKNMSLCQCKKTCPLWKKYVICGQKVFCTDVTFCSYCWST